MRADTREARRKEIATAALELLATQGYAATTMQAVARAAGASMETLYNWYGDKTGLFRALVEYNARDVRDVLEASAGGCTDVVDLLRDLGPRLLALLTGETAIALNRAAVSDASGELGAQIAAAGRDTIAPLIERVFERAGREGRLGIDDPRMATEVYLGLLVGDCQIRRVIGQLKPLTRSACRKRSDRAADLIERLFAIR